MFSTGVGLFPTESVAALRRSGADGDHEEGSEGDDRVDIGGYDDHADERGEDDEEHHPRLQKRHVIRDIALGQARSRDGFATGLG